MFHLLLTLSTLCVFASVAMAAQKVTLTWEHTPGESVTGYQIQRCAGSADCLPADLPGAITTGAKTYTDLTVELGHMYCYTVVALQDDLRSAPSPVACASTFTEAPAEESVQRTILFKFPAPPAD